MQPRRAEDRKLGRFVRSAPGHSLQDLASSAEMDLDELTSRLGALPARGRCGELLAAAAGTRRAVTAAAHRWCPPWARRLVAGGAGGQRINPELSLGEARLLGVLMVSSARKRASSSDPTDRVSASGYGCPRAAMWRLCSDDDPFVALGAASELRTAPPGSPEDRLAQRTYEHLAALTGFGFDHTRLCVAEDAACPPHVLQRLITDADEGVRAAVARNERCPPDALAELAGDDAIAICHAVACNPNCSSDTLGLLAADPASPSVASAASHALQQRQ